MQFKQRRLKLVHPIILSELCSFKIFLYNLMNMQLLTSMFDSSLCYIHFEIIGILVV